MKLTTSRSTGHLAMSHTVTAAPPSPTRFATCFASPPVSTTATAETARRVIITSVTASLVGTVL